MKTTISAGGHDARSVVRPSNVQRLGFEPHKPDEAANGRLPEPNSATATGRSDYGQSAFRRTQREDVHGAGVLVKATEKFA